jgi:mannitol/fructose-specific phosphotransferase system IIA component (Ntr-type)
MLISQHLKKEAVSLDLKGESMTEVLEELAGLISQPNSDLKSADIRENLLQREKLLSTASGCGVAFPHCYCPVKNPRFAIGISREGIEADAPDNKPVHIFLVVISPEKNPNAHLEALSAASRIFLKEEIRNQVSLAENPAEVLDIIKEAENRFDG